MSLDLRIGGKLRAFGTEGLAFLASSCDLIFLVAMILAIVSSGIRVFLSWALIQRLIESSVCC